MTSVASVKDDGFAVVAAIFTSFSLVIDGGGVVQAMVQAAGKGVWRGEISAGYKHTSLMSATMRATAPTVIAPLPESRSTPRQTALLEARSALVGKSRIVSPVSRSARTRSNCACRLSQNSGSTPNQ